MKIIHGSTPCLLHLLLLADLIVQTSSRPTSSPLCFLFKSAIHQVDRLTSLSKQLHEMADDELTPFAGMEYNLKGLPHIDDSAEYFTSLKVNKSLAQLYVHTQSFRMHVDWLKTARENVSLPAVAAKNGSIHLHQLSNLLNTSLAQISAEVPHLPTATPIAFSTTFDVIKISVEISERLQVFCEWSKRVLRWLQAQYKCRKY